MHRRGATLEALKEEPHKSEGRTHNFVENTVVGKWLAVRAGSHLFAGELRTHSSVGLTRARPWASSRRGRDGSALVVSENLKAA